MKKLKFKILFNFTELIKNMGKTKSKEKKHQTKVKATSIVALRRQKTRTHNNNQKRDINGPVKIK